MVENAEQHNLPKRKDRVGIRTFFFVVMFFVVLTLALFPSILDHVPTNLLVISIIGVFLAGGWFQWFSWHNSWQDFAANTKLTYTRSKILGGLFYLPRITGIYQGFPVQIERHTRGIGKYQKVYTLIRVILKWPLSNLLIINRRTWFLNLKMIFKPNHYEAKYIDLGDEEFGTKVEIRSNSVSLARITLSSDRVRQELIEIANQAPEMKITVRDNELIYTEHSNITDTAYLAALLDTLVDFAQQLEYYGP